MPFHDVLQEIIQADIVITHAGNTVRLVQREMKVPIAMAREAALGEMGNDHQVAYLREEERTGRVIPVWNAADLDHAVAYFPTLQAEIMSKQPLPASASAEAIMETMTRLCQKWVR